MFRLQGKGVPEMGGVFAGDIMLMVDVVVPKNLAPYQVELLKSFNDSLSN
jgi:DnaJ-class molecular chaperone